MRWYLSSLAALVPLFPQIAAAQEDAAGCQDSKLLTRLSGCHISSCDKSDFDAAELMIDLAASVHTKHVEGKVENIRSDCQGKSALQVRRNAEQALRGAAFDIDFTGYDVPTHYVTAHKGALWVAVEASELSGDSQYRFTSVATGELVQEMTTDADAWAKEIAKSGHVAVYGIEFDIDKATLKPAAEKVLGQVLALLKAQPDWKMRIEGHTDSTGSSARNKTLSQQRAAAVVAWLTKNGIAAARLAALGLGDTKPVADNKTEDGRAKNRRVELVKQ